MTPQVLPGATYGEFWPTGIGATAQTVPPGLETDLLFVRVASDGRIAGKTHTPGHVAYWDGSQWLPLGPTLTPNNPCAFHPTSGELYVAVADSTLVYARSGALVRIIPDYVGSNGIRWIGPDGSIVSGDATFGLPGLLGEHVRVGDISIGQGIAGGLEAVWGGARHHVCDGQIDALRVTALGEAVTCYWTDWANGYRLDTTLTALRALPPVPNPITPVPDPITTPPPHPEPPVSYTLPPNVLSIMRRYVTRYPVPQMSGPGPSDSAFEDTCRQWCLYLAEQVVHDTGDSSWGVKNAGGGRPQSKDSLSQQTGGKLINFDLLGGVGTGHPTLVEQPSGEDITGQAFMPVLAIDHLGSEPPPPEQPQPPAPDLSELRTQIADICTQIANITQRLDDLAAKPAPTVPDLSLYAKHGDAVSVTGSLSLSDVWKGTKATWTGTIK